MQIDATFISKVCRCDEGCRPNNDLHIDRRRTAATIITIFQIMIGDYDDDTHFCLKCHSTIIGLDNYVAHRKEGCPKTAPKSPLPSQLLPDDSFNLKADDFFSSLELQSSAKKLPTKNSGVRTRSKTAVIQENQSKSGKNVWIGGHQLKLGHGDNQSKLIKAVDNLERRKEDPLKINVYEDSEESEEYDFEDETSDEDHDAPPKNHTGGKWKPSSPIQWSYAPPPSHTGGKWRRQSPPPSHTKGKWKPSFPLSPKEFDFPPPSFTGGKWTKPKIDDDDKKKKKEWRLLAPEDKKLDDSPFRKSSGTVQYWCRPCNRRLASKVVYERHLKSELHFKRTLHDKEFDDHLGIVTDKRSKKKPQTVTKVKKRNRKKIYTKCEVCNSRVTKNLIGKHLISHYHCRKGDITTLVAQTMVLNNIEEIVLQSPFQCGLCKFYFNHNKDFLAHWLSPYHSSRAQHDGYFWCSLCKFKDRSSDVMYQHLVSEEHEVVVSVINRSVPIVVKKITPVECQECHEEFLYNIALKKHCQIQGHTSAVSGVACNQCSQVFRSNISLKRHRIVVHGDNIFICTVCDKTFSTKDEARVHRNSSDHRYRVAKKQHRKCDYCSEVFTTIQDLKNHLRTKHPEFDYKCGLCGSSFTLPQELSVHLRTKSCTFKESFEGNSCDRCPFSSSSTSELIFHKVLHTEPLLVQGSQKKPMAQYKCPLCEKLFVKASLQGHLRVHTKERPFVCSICSKGFVRKNNWVLHVKNHEVKVKKSAKVESGSRPFLCSTCGASFAKKKVLQQHMTTHSGKTCKCPKTGCIFAARSMAELKQHFSTHSDVKSFGCDLCEYRGKTKQQLKSHLTVHAASKRYPCTKCSFAARTLCHLKRHTRLHTGSKPYSCPHCAYKCNTLENLRKHVLVTNKHPGKCIYECKFCTTTKFQSNFSKEFKVHLVNQHPEIFKTGREATTFIAGIYDEQDDCTEFPPGQDEDPPGDSQSQPKIIVLHQSTKDPVVGASHSKDTEEIFPMYIVSKDDNLTESWNVVGSYDVEESGALVPFNDNVLFQGHF